VVGAAAVAGGPKYEKALEELKAKIKALQKRTNDPWLLKLEHE
jgi:hypothetical protein